MWWFAVPHPDSPPEPESWWSRLAVKHDNGNNEGNKNQLSKCGLVKDVEDGIAKFLVVENMSNKLLFHFFIHVRLS